MRIRTVVVTLASGVALAGCEGLKEALSAHTDSAARAVNQELSATSLGSLLGDAKIGVEPTKENAQIVADLWVDYQRIGYASAHNDSLGGNLTTTMKPLLDNMRVSMMIDTLRARIKADCAVPDTRAAVALGGKPGCEGTPETGYNAGAGGFYAARHILFKYPQVNNQPGTATPAEKDSVRKIAVKIFPQINAANFVAMAKKYSGDPSNAGNGGMLGLFPREQMIPEFSAATAALKPGELSKDLVETAFGLHVIQRLTYAEIKAQYDPSYAEIAQRAMDSTLSANLTKAGNVTVKDNAPVPVREAIKNVTAHKKDNTVIATFNGGSMTVAQFLGWVDVMPMQMRQQVMQIVPTWPDSSVKPFVRNMAMRQMLLHQADSAKLDVPAEEKANLTVQFNQLVQQVWSQLNLTPKALADSAKSEKEREKLAASRVDSLMKHIMNGEASPVGVPLPLKAALDSKWEAKINMAGLDRAAEIARKIRTSADSARAKAPSGVPIPGMPGPVPPPTGTAPPPGTKKP